MRQVEDDRVMSGWNFCGCRWNGGGDINDAAFFLQSPLQGLQHEWVGANEQDVHRHRIPGGIPRGVTERLFLYEQSNRQGDTAAQTEKSDGVNRMVDTIALLVR